MTGKSLVQRPGLPLAPSSTATYSAGSQSRALDPALADDPLLDRRRAEQLESMKNPLTRARKASPPSGANIDVTPSSASTTRTIGSRFLRPSSHKSATSSYITSEVSSSRSSGLTSLSRFNPRGNQSSVSVRNDDSYSRTASTREDDAIVTLKTNTLGPSSTIVPMTGDHLPRLQHKSSGNNLLAASSNSAISASASTSSKTSLVLPTPGSTSESNAKPSRPRGLVGLQNLGNTCFMNSCLQCVSNLPAMVKYFQSGEYLKEINQSSPTKGTLAVAFGDLIKALWTSPEFTATRPVELKRVIGKVASRFTGYDQQDAQEFLRFLLDGLHEDLNRIIKKPPYYEIKDRENVKDREVSDEYWKFYADRNRSTLSELFCGQLRSEIRCHTCNHRSLCFDVFWDLSVPVPKKPKASHHMRIASVFSKDDSDASSPTSSNGCTIQDCLKAYTDQECLQESDSYYCSKCKTHRAVSKKISLYRLPQVLVVHLKRFSYSTFSRDKVSTAIKFPAQGLDLSDYCAQDAVLDGSTLYDLSGVVNHVGSLNGGHYTAECVNADTNEWYDFNDSSVSLIKKPQLCSSSAYILFFRRRAEKSLTI